jgi:hypothetical protein
MMVTCHEGVTDRDGFRPEIICSKKSGIMIGRKSGKHSDMCDYVV